MLRELSLAYDDARLNGNEYEHTYEGFGWLNDECVAELDPITWDPIGPCP